MSIKNWKIVKNGITEIHAMSPNNYDVSLCCHDLVGDSINGDEWSEAVLTDEKVNCRDCISVINFCKKFPEKLIGASIRTK